MMYELCSSLLILLFFSGAQIFFSENLSVENRKGENDTFSSNNQIGAARDLPLKRGAHDLVAKLFPSVGVHDLG